MNTRMLNSMLLRKELGEIKWFLATNENIKGTSQTPWKPAKAVLKLP